MLSNRDVFPVAPDPDSPAAGRLLALNEHHRKRLKSPPGQPARAKDVELNFFADFKPGPWKTEGEIIAAINANRDDWFPGTLELKKFAESGHGRVEGVANLWNLLAAIVRHGSVGRVNIFTHANSGYIALSGRVSKGEVRFNPDPAAELNDEIISKADDEGFTFSDSRTKAATFKQVREALGNKAVVFIYACHAGLDKDYLKQIAKALHITVNGFTADIRYHPIIKRGRITGWKYSVGTSEQQVLDFHELDKSAISVTGDPSR